jgi:hypothetical protein
MHGAFFIAFALFSWIVRSTAHFNPQQICELRFAMNFAPQTQHRPTFFSNFSSRLFSERNVGFA